MPFEEKGLGMDNRSENRDIAEKVTTEAKEFAENIVDTIRDPLLILDADLRVMSASRAFYQNFEVSQEETKGQLIYNLGNQQWNIPSLRKLLEEILPQNTIVNDYEVEHDFEHVGKRIMYLNARRIYRETNNSQLILLAIEDVTERKRLENLLIDSEERFRRLFETADDGILLLEKREGKIAHANPSVKRILGYSEEESIGKDLQDIGVLHRMGDINELSKTLNNEGIIHLDNIPLQTKDGKTIDAEMYCVDKTSLIQCNIRDITERKQSERDLNESLLQQKEIVKASNIGLWDWDIITNKVKYSAEWKAQIGYDEHEISDDFKEWETRIHPDDLMLVHEKIQNTIDKKRKTYQAEFRFRHKNGSYRWILAQGSLSLDESGRPIKMRGSHIDITERKRSEQELMESKQKFKSMVENIGIGVAMISLSMEVLELNRQMSEWFPDVDLRQRPICHQAFNNPPRDHICDDCPTAKTLQDGKVHESITTKPGAGGVRNFRIISSPIFDKKGEVIVAIEMVEDITERIETEARLRQAQKLESIGTLAGGIAHDFNNILSSIIGFTELSLDEVGKGTNLHDNLQEVYTAGNRAKDLTKQILTFARQSNEELKPIQLDTIAKQVINFIRASIPTTIEIKHNIERNSPIMGDATQVHQILMNLCTNAAYAMEEKGGILELNLKDVIIDYDSVLCKLGLEPGNYIEMKISDTGTGIPKNILDSIFTPYFTTKPTGEGTGMGLSIVHGIVENYGGKVLVASEIGKGSIFTFYLPICKQKVINHIYDPKVLPSGTERILFIDDEASIAKMSKQMLESLGYSVTVLTSSVEALELFKSNPGKFDLVITDMTMPNMTGDKLAAKLMAIQSDIPIILCTGFSKKISNGRASDIGIKAIVYKPVVKADFAKTVRKVLDEAKGFAHA